jgi:uncharacterized protein
VIANTHGIVRTSSASSSSSFKSYHSFIQVKCILEVPNLTSSMALSTDFRETTSLAPLNDQERIVIIDSLRGIALLGILMMNIPGFAMPNPSWTDPTVLNEIGTINYKVWYFIDWFLEGSQRALFSTLFGAGIIVFTSRLEQRGAGIMAAELFMRRQLWLLVFGLINAFLFLWFWDILYAYAIAGAFLFAFRRLDAKTLIICAIISLGLQTARENRDFYQEKDVINKGEAVLAIDTVKTKLTEDQKGELQAMQGFKKESSLESKQKRAAKNVEMVQGGFASVYKVHGDRSEVMETKFLYHVIFDIFLFMFIGMAFYKIGMLQGEYPMKTYLIMAILGLGVGLYLSYVRLAPHIQYQFNQFDITKNTSFAFYEISRSIRAIGIFGLIMTVYKTGLFNWLFNLVRPVGQMAFTNYLMQSVACGLIFYGFGFGLFGKLQRYEIYFVVAAVWAFQIIASNIWLRYYRFGPMEWLWRSLTYWKMQPFRKASATERIAEAVA